MSESLLKALMQLFGLAVSFDGVTARERVVVKEFLSQQLNAQDVEKYLEVFDQTARFRALETTDKGESYTSVRISSKMLLLCTQMNQELTQRQKILVVLRMAELIASNNQISSHEAEFINTVASVFNLKNQELQSILHFVEMKEIGNHFLDDVLYITPFSNIKYKYHLQQANLNGIFAFLRVTSLEMYMLKYLGNKDYYLNGVLLKPNQIYMFPAGSSIRGNKLDTIYYSDISSLFRKDKNHQDILLEAKNIFYDFSNGKKAIQNVDIAENSGTLVGIMGASGSGKSTLLEIMNGNITPKHGKVLINGVEVHKNKMEGIIGYIPQDDLLVENLTVHENLYYAAALCFGDYTQKDIEDLVNQTLVSIGLYEVKDQRVGTVLERVLSGGQRKRLNIGLELIRKPSVLFVDEPTSGLSSRDSENIMDLLKELSFMGKLVFVVIHQPSSDIFKMFDSLLILDMGGVPIYYGNPIGAIIHFKNAVNQVDSEQAECPECGNIEVEQIFDIIETRVIDEYGSFTEKRKVLPMQWFEIYEKKKTTNNVIPSQEPLTSPLKRPNDFGQFLLFAKRDAASKLKDRQYLWVSMLQAPLLAVLLSYVHRYYPNKLSNYQFSENDNLPAYVFIAIIVAIFMGLVVSAEEIFADKKILKRENFLNLSRNSYLASKVAILFVISAVQTLVLVWIGNTILGIQGMYFTYWLVLFSCACFANLLGLNISSTFHSAVTIYVLIPILLIPQLILGGIVIPFDKINPDMNVNNSSQIPLVAETMVSRWAFEALAVSQFRDNAYTTQFYDWDKQIAVAEFKKVYTLPMLEATLAFVVSNYQNVSKKEEITQKLLLIRTELEKELFKMDKKELKNLYLVDFKNFQKNQAKSLTKIIAFVRQGYQKKQRDALQQKDKYMAQQKNTDNLRKTYQNEALAILLKNSQTEERLLVLENELKPRLYPIYFDGEKLFSHFFAPTKRIFGLSVNTLWVNVGIIWAMVVLLYSTLYFDFFRKIIRFFTARFVSIQ